MSAAANNWLKDRPLITVLFSFVGSLILVFVSGAQSADREEQQLLKEEMDLKADKTYVDNRVNNVEGKYQIELNNIKKALDEIKEDGKETRGDIKEILKKL
ncbi:MAG: hypothetical protein GY928_14615 [Colwellia sp.]|nr:hypothetical protein [Colwellia sp.]